MPGRLLRWPRALKSVQLVQPLRLRTNNLDEAIDDHR